jgi:hypothetical protein
LHKGLGDESILVPTRDGTPDYSQPYISGFEYSRPDEEDLTSTATDNAWPVYTHPDYMGVDRERYRKTFDMYSMGIILLEIAWWKPADEILGFTQPVEVVEQKDAGKAADGKHESPDGEQDMPEKQKPAQKTQEKSPTKKMYSKDSLDDLKRIRKRLLTDEPALLGHVAATMGPRYHDAVRACIGGREYFGLPTDADETREVMAALLLQAYLRLVVDVLRGIKV